MEELDTDVSGEITTTQTREDAENHRIFIQTHNNPNREYSANTRAGRWDFPSPYKIGFRVVRFKLSTGMYETLATNLPRDKFSIQNLKEMYASRWGIETAFREWKIGVGLVNLHGKSEEFAAQEVYSTMLMFNYCSRIVSQVVLANRENCVHEYAVNREMAHVLCKQYLRGELTDADKLMYQLSRYVEPIRLGRSDRRRIQPKSFGGFVYRVPA